MASLIVLIILIIFLTISIKDTLQKSDFKFLMNKLIKIFLLIPPISSR